MLNLRFLRIAIKDYKVGALTESSKYTISKIISNIKPEYRHIVEYGAGSGVITKILLQNLPRDGRLFAIESNKNFILELAKIKDDRLTIVDGDVAILSKNLLGAGPPTIDAVVSGIPFTLIKPQIRDEIIRNTHAALKDGGIFVVYQYSPLILPLLKKYFAKISISFEPRNFPPYFIMKAKKRQT